MVTSRDGSSARSVVRFDPVINVGHIATACVFVLTSLASSVAVYSSLQRVDDNHELRIAALERQFGQIAVQGTAIFAAITDIKVDIATLKARSIASGRETGQ